MVTGLRAPGSRGSLNRLCWLVAVALGGTAPAYAQAPANAPMARPAASPVFAIKGFKITGENPLGDGETAAVLAPFLRADANIDTLQKATSTLETALRDRGFGLHRVAHGNPAREALAQPHVDLGTQVGHLVVALRHGHALGVENAAAHDDSRSEHEP